MGDFIVSGSALPRLRLCQYWARPDVPRSPGGDSDVAKLGRAFHELVAATFDDPCGGLEPEWIKDFAEERGVPVDDLLPLLESWVNSRWATRLLPNPDDVLGGLVEVAYAWDWLRGTARRLEVAGHREYEGLGASEIPLTTDYVWLSADEAVVIDWKTGVGWHLAPVEVNLQVRTAALAVMRTHGVKRVKAAIVRIWPGGASIQETTFGELECDATEAELRRLFEAVPSSVPCPGQDQCVWCPARGDCPSTGEAMAGLVPSEAPAAPVPLVGPIESAHVAEVRYALLAPMKAAIEIYEERLKLWADEHGGIATPSGKLYKGVPEEREDVNIELAGAEEALVEVLGRLGAAAAISRKASKTSIGEGAKLASKELGTPKKTLEALALTRLREVGAITSKTVTRYREVRE